MQSSWNIYIALWHKDDSNFSEFWQLSHARYLNFLRYGYNTSKDVVTNVSSVIEDIECKLLLVSGKDWVNPDWSTTTSFSLLRKTLGFSLLTQELYLYNCKSIKLQLCKILLSLWLKSTILKYQRSFYGVSSKEMNTLFCILSVKEGPDVRSSCIECRWSDPWTRHSLSSHLQRITQFSRFIAIPQMDVLSGRDEVHGLLGYGSRDTNCSQQVLIKVSGHGAHSPVCLLFM